MRSVYLEHHGSVPFTTSFVWLPDVDLLLVVSYMHGACISTMHSASSPFYAHLVKENFPCG